jgi:hypothetical protein
MRILTLILFMSSFAFGQSAEKLNKYFPPVYKEVFERAVEYEYLKEIDRVTPKL